MPDLVVHQWGRLGDLLQTAILLSRWKSQAGGRTVLIYDGRYSAVVKRIVSLDLGIPLDLRQIVQWSHSDKDCLLLPALNQAIRDMQLARGGVHFVLSRTPAAGLLSSLLEPDESVGYTWTSGELREPTILQEWLYGPNNDPYPIHICDVWSKIVGLSCTDLPEDVLGIGRYKNTMAEGAARILVFTDAGESYRTPPIEWLARLCSTLCRKQHFKITLVGTQTINKSDILSRFTAESPGRVTDLRGRTSLPELLELSEANDIVIGADTGGLHLAAAAGCVPIGLYSGGASVFNTGPYCLDAFVLQNPAWNDADINAIEAAIRQRTDGKIHDGQAAPLPLWTPLRDDLGISYSHPLWNCRSRQDVLQLRETFNQTISNQQKQTTNKADVVLS